MINILYILVIATLTIMLVGLAVIDLRTRTVPNQLIVPFALLALCQQVLLAGLENYSILRVITNDITWATIILLALVLLQWLCSKLNNAGLGGGDIKLLVALSLIFQVWTFAILFIACISSIFTALFTRQRSFAFVPYIAFGAVLTFIIAQLAHL